MDTSIGSVFSLDAVYAYAHSILPLLELVLKQNLIAESPSPNMRIYLCAHQDRDGTQAMTFQFYRTENPDDVPNLVDTFVAGSDWHEPSH